MSASVVLVLQRDTADLHCLFTHCMLCVAAVPVGLHVLSKLASSVQLQPAPITQNKQLSPAATCPNNSKQTAQSSHNLFMRNWAHSLADYLGCTWKPAIGEARHNKAHACKHTKFNVCRLELCCFVFLAPAEQAVSLSSLMSYLFRSALPTNGSP